MPTHHDAEIASCNWKACDECRHSYTRDDGDGCTVGPDIWQDSLKYDMFAECINCGCFEPKEEK